MLNSYEWSNEPKPPRAADIDGPTSGNIKESVIFVFKATDSNDKDVKYFISCEDGNTD